MVRGMLGEMVAQKGNSEFFIFLRRCDRHLDFPYRGPGIHPVYVVGRPNLLANMFALSWKAWRLKLDAGIFQYFAPPFCRCRRIVIIHDIIFEERPEYFTLAERIYFRPMRWLARRAQVIATISHVEKMRLVRRGYAKEGSIEVLHPGVSDRFKPLEDIPPLRREEVRSRFGLPPRFLLYLGRLNVRKNILALLNALTCLNDQTIPLVLAGAADGKEEDIEAEIRRLGLAERIIRTGYVCDGDLPVLMALATLFCYVSYDEGFGLPVLEAMSCGVPVVVSRKEVLQEICGPAGNYVDPGDPGSIAAAIDRLLADPALRHSQSALGRVQCLQFSWRRSAERLLALCGSPAALQVIREASI
jgi:glycosyltransferase involved in cell wall biosynthesis